MKSITKFLFLALLLLAPSSLSAKTEKVIKILAIGNSFSEDAVEQNLYDLALADGKKVIIGNMYIGGCSLEKHLKNAKENIPAYRYRKIGLDGVKVQTTRYTLEKALADEDWDYISFQERSGWSGKYDSWEKSLPELLAYVKSHAPKKTKMVIHQTWAYDQTSDHKAFSKYKNDEWLMYTSIMSAVRDISQLTGIKIIIPSGTAIQNARTTVLKDRITRDGFHLHLVYGRYIAACAWYEKVFKRSVVGNDYAPAGMTEDEKLLAQKSAHAAVKKPYEVTEIK